MTIIDFGGIIMYSIARTILLDFTMRPRESDRINLSWGSPSFWIEISSMTTLFDDVSGGRDYFVNFPTRHQFR